MLMCRTNTKKNFLMLWNIYWWHGAWTILMEDFLLKNTTTMLMSFGIEHFSSFY